VSTVAGGGRLRLAQSFLRDIRSPDWGLAGQGFRFALAGIAVASLYVTVTTVLHNAFAVPFQVALAVGFVVGVALHFTLQRVFVWRHHDEFALAMHHQMARYMLVCASQYGITALSTSQLPSVLDLPVEVVYLATMLTVAAVNFMLFRGRVFHSSAEPKREAMS